MKWNKLDVVMHMVHASGMTRREVESVLDLLSSTAAGALSSPDSEFTVPGICKIQKVLRPERQWHHPATGAPMILKAKSVLKFKPLKEIRDAAEAPAKTEAPAEASQ